MRGATEGDARGLALEPSGADAATVGELVDQARAGNARAFDELYRRSVDAARSVARRSVSDPHAVNDIVQEAFTRALENLDRLVSSERFVGWLLSITRNVAVDHVREKHVLVDQDPLELRIPDGAPPPDELAELSELAGLVRGCVHALTTRDATAIGLVSHFGFSTAEVAEALGVKRGAAKVVVHRARRRLKETIRFELLLRARAHRCADLARLVESDVVTAARHVRDCPTCDEQAQDEVQAYDAPSYVTGRRRAEL